MNYFENCTALITGASSGLGREFAIQLAPYARALVLVARRLERLDDLKTQLEGQYPGLVIFTYGLDVSDDAKLDEFCGWLGTNAIHVDFLINNAGLGDHGLFEESDWQRVKQMLEVNIVALTRLTHRLLPEMRQRARGAIINVSSIAGFLPLPDMAVYAASKAYVTSFSEALRAELRGTGISVTALCPGPIDTEFGTVARRSAEAQIPAPDALKISAEQAVREGLSAAASDRARVVPGLLIAILMAITCMVPMALLRIFMKSRSRHETGLPVGEKTFTI